MRSGGGDAQRAGHCRRWWSTAATVAVLSAATLAVTEPALARADGPGTVTAPLVQRVSADALPAYNANPTQPMLHSTEVETDTYSWGSTVVAAFQVGRNKGSYGAQAIGWSTSTDNGQSWTSGILPGVTVSSPHPNSAYPLAVNQSVSYSARWGRWVVPSVTYVPATSSTGASIFREKALLVNTSADGVSWADATTAVPTNVDKAWVACDNTATSPGYGNCYVGYSQLDSGEALAVVTSTDGGLTWSAPINVPSTKAGTNLTGYNTNLVVQPNGTVVMAATDAVKNGLNGSTLFATTSTDLGTSFSTPTTIATIKYHAVTGGFRALNKPSIDVDANGTVYVAWGDCRFRSSCAHDDIVYATSTTGRTWSAPVRVPLDDPATTTTDRFIPGIAIAPGTAGPTAQISVVSYTLAIGACGASPKPACRLDAQYATSYDGGATWSTPRTINSVSMPATWLAKSSKGAMVGDYLSISFCQGSAITVVSLATAAVVKGRYSEGEWALTLPPGSA